MWWLEVLVVLVLVLLLLLVVVVVVVVSVVVVVVTKIHTSLTHLSKFSDAPDIFDQEKIGLVLL